tara:strand:- start:432 stop:1424 length:993 start_codon:yes stop_codon:yes gene_type:complete
MSNRFRYLNILLISILYFIVIYFFAGIINTNIYYLSTFCFLFFIIIFIYNINSSIVSIYEQIDSFYYNIVNDKKKHTSLPEIIESIDFLIEFLNDRNESIEKLTKYRSQFLGNVSHELKTPIFTMQGYVDTLLDGAINDPGVNKKFIKKIKLQSERIESLLTDLIKISMIESNELKLNKKDILLSDIIKEINLRYSHILIKRGNKLLLPDVGSIKINADKNAMLSVFDNLVANAINYSDSGDIILSVKYHNDEIVISIIDHGIGIDQEQLDRIFERFYRVDSDRSRASGGTGLGLSIVKHILLAHDTNIEVKSELSFGSTFSFSFPILKS